MFTGIIQSVGVVKEVISKGSNRVFWIESPVSPTLKPDQSVSHNGACLTVEKINGNTHRITAVRETLDKTNLGNWKEQVTVNLELGLRLNDRLDGHMVQGHVDTMAVCSQRKEQKGSWEYQFEFPKKFAELVIEKGSIAVNGVSLTAFDVRKKSFRVAVIPYTFEHTNMQYLQEGDTVNLEFDMIGKYLLRRLSLSEGLPRRKSNH